MKRIAISWSRGKDCAWALRSLPEAGHLITTFDESTGLLPIHKVPLAKIEAQAAALRMPFIAIPLPPNCPNSIYIERFAMASSLFDAIVFGDLFLEDIRRFREQSFPKQELLFPLWQSNTAELAHQMIEGGLVATITSANDPSLVGRVYDKSFLASLPPGTDPCGENGEFHTWVHPECLASFR